MHDIDESRITSKCIQPPLACALIAESNDDLFLELGVGAALPVKGD